MSGRARKEGGDNNMSKSEGAAEDKAKDPTYDVRAYQNPDAGADEATLKGKSKKGRSEASRCYRCGAPSTKACGRCRRARYCGDSCFKEDWPRHKGWWC